MFSVDDIGTAEYRITERLRMPETVIDMASLYPALAIQDIHNILIFII